MAGCGTPHQQLEGGSENLGNGSGEINWFSSIQGLTEVLRVQGLNFGVDNILS